MALFSTVVTDEQKSSIAKALLNAKPEDSSSLPQARFGLGYGKPVFPTDIGLNTELADLVTADSWFLFESLQLQPQFLREEVMTWSSSSSYKTSLENVRAINVINDSAERGVKMCSDFQQSARKETNIQNVLQVVEKDRRSLPNLRKRKVSDA